MEDIQTWLREGWQEFTYQQGELCCEEVSLNHLAREVGLPFYVYSSRSIREAFLSYKEGFGDQKHIIAYAVKANENLSIIHLLRQLGAGADIVSVGQLYRAQLAGIPGHKILYSGVGKTDREIRAALEAGILFFNVESEEELVRISQISEEVQIRAGIAIRINPDVDPKTHPYISTGMKEHKFGVEIPAAIELYRRAEADPWLEVRGIQCHIGSQITEPSPHREALERVLMVRAQLSEMGIETRYIDLGGGLGIRYSEEEPPAPAEFVRGLLEIAGGLDVSWILEPGRSIVGNSGALICQVLYRKEHGGKHYTIVDAGMNDLIRPAIYEAFHPILPVCQSDQPDHRIHTEVVGPICESTDQFAWDRSLPPLEQKDLLAILAAGAYGAAMSSNYNAKPFCPEILVDGKEWRLIRRRQTIEELVAFEREFLAEA
ncbi:MAG: diaminopimelate decarboxylase [Candidatus Omnitrophica bacterium]|nr:diaminopimelate decarboxylase [bacterium]MCL4735061.1 diaminopimelate decarboxylase [Candidatus Omnitrophota bacterium]NUP92641.1 diaminopimelate decarboxylase [Candidatus Omnitrophota bacterium]